MGKKEMSPKIARWSLLLEDFDYVIVHRPGSQMEHADALSRNSAVLLSQTQTADDVTCKIAASQQEDEHCNLIKELVNLGKEDNCLIKNDVLYKYDAGRELLVVPEAMQSQIIKKVHSTGHFATSKTEELIKRDFHISGLRKKVETVISNCLECILCNKKRGKGEGFLNPIPKEDVPLSTYHIDFIGPLPSTNKNYKHVFTVVDAFTKFIWLYPVKSTSTQDALDKLKLQQKTFGNPSRIISDRGSAFSSKEFADYCQSEKIEHLQITTGIPRGNGQIERMHGTLIPVLAKLSIDDSTKWFKYVDAVQRILNSTIARSIKISPFELLTGVKMKNKEDLRVTEILQEEYVNSFLKNREELRREAKEKILKIQEENKKNFDRKRKESHKYKEGDLVAIERTQFGTGLKLRPKFFGPYKVVKVKPKDRYDVVKIGLHDGPTSTSTAADKMKPWNP